MTIVVVTKTYKKNQLNSQTSVWEKKDCMYKN